MGLDTQVTDASVFFTESTVALGSNTTFTGPWRDSVNYNWVAALVMTDADATATNGLFIDEADANPPNIINTVAAGTGSGTAPVTNNANSPSGGFVHRQTPLKIVLRQVRVRFKNGANAQTRLNLQSVFSPLN